MPERGMEEERGVMSVRVTCAQLRKREQGGNLQRWWVSTRFPPSEATMYARSFPNGWGVGALPGVLAGILSTCPLHKSRVLVGTP